MADSTVKVSFIGDASSLKRATDDADGHLGKMSSGIGDFAKKAAIGFAVVGVAAGAFAKSAIDAASDLVESQSKVSVVFGESAKEIEAWASTAAKSMGMSKQAALEAAGTFGNLFSAMKISSPEAVKMSKGIVELAADLASFNNANPADVLIALKAGLVGETEPLRAFGVNLSAARIEAEALSKGMVKGEVDLLKLKEAQQKVNEVGAEYVQIVRKHGTASAEATKANLAREKAEEQLNKVMGGAKPVLDAATKAQAAYSLIMQDTTLAQGDFARTSGGLANKQRIMAAQFADIRAEIGMKLLPVMIALVSFVSDELIPAVGKASKWMEEHKGVVIAAAAVIGGVLVAALIAWAVSAAAAAAATIVAAAPVIAITLAIAALAAGIIYAYKHWGWFKDAVDTAGDAAQWLWSHVLKPFGEWIVNSLVPWIRDDLIPVIKKIGTTIGDIAQVVAGITVRFWQFIVDVKDIATDTIEAFVGIADGIWEAFKSVFNNIADLWNNTVGSLSFEIPGWVPGIGGKGFDVPDIPKFKIGGMVDGPIGAPQLAIVHGGERVQTPAQQQGGSVFIFEMNGREFARAIVDESTRSGGLPIRIRAAS